MFGSFRDQFKCSDVVIRGASAQYAIIINNNYRAKNLIMTHSGANRCGTSWDDYFSRLDSITTVINIICYYFLLTNIVTFRTCVIRNIVINNNKTVLYAD